MSKKNPEVNKTYSRDSTSDIPSPSQQSINLLAVPKSWTRLVIATVTLLFMVVALVSLMVFLSWGNTQDNYDRILQLRKEVDELKLKKCDPPCIEPKEPK